MSESLEWLSGSARPKRPKGWVPCRVWNVPLGKQLLMYALQERPWGVFTHYVEVEPGVRRTRLCTGSSCLCAERPLMSRRWMGYLPVVAPDLVSTGIMTISKRADSCLDSMRVAKGTIIGTKLMAQRMPFRPGKMKKNDEVSITVYGESITADKLPETFDPRPTVLIMFGFEEDAIDKLLAKAARYG